MDLTYLLCLAVVLFLNSVFDGFILIARAVRVETPLFGSKLSLYTNLLHGLLFLGPVVEMVSASMCWKIYREHLANLMSEEGWLADQAQGNDDYGSVERADTRQGNVAGQ